MNKTHSFKKRFLITMMLCGYVFIALFIIFNAHYKEKYGENIPFFGYSSACVVSGSMEPLIMTDECVLIETVSPDDDITFSEDTTSFEGVYVYLDEYHYFEKESLILHRCVGIDEDGKYIFKGDANQNADPIHVDRHNIIAKVHKTTNLKFDLAILYIVPVVLMEILLLVTMRKWFSDDEDDYYSEDNSSKNNYTGWE